MTLPTVLLVLAVGLTMDASSGPARPPYALVAQLGSTRYADREAATAALRELGPAALPALRSARSARDAEVRARAAALLERVESELMVRPTLVRLDYRDRPLAEIVRDLGRQSGINLTLMPEHANFWNGRRATLVEGEPIPFWKAVDRLCEAGRLNYNPQMQMGFGGRSQVFQLQDGPGTTQGPRVDSGPFRTSLLSVSHHRDLYLNQGPQPQALFIAPGNGHALARRAVPRPVADQFYFSILVTGEPRLIIRQNGPLKLTEAVDDKGQSLLFPSTDAQVQRYAGYYGYNQGTQSFQVQQHLRYPSKPGKMIRRIHGTVPILVSARKADPLVVPLADAAGKTFKNDHAAIVINDSKPEPSSPGSTLIDLTVRTTGLDDLGPANGMIFDGNFGFQPDNTQSQFEIVDSQGKPIPWYPQQTSSRRPHEVRMTLMLVPNGVAGAPASLRYFDLARASAEVAFEFNDLPMP